MRTRGQVHEEESGAGDGTAGKIALLLLLFVSARPVVVQSVQAEKAARRATARGAKATVTVPAAWWEGRYKEAEWERRGPGRRSEWAAAHSQSGQPVVAKSVGGTLCCLLGPSPCHGPPRTADSGTHCHRGDKKSDASSVWKDDSS